MRSNVLTNCSYCYDYRIKVFLPHTVEGQVSRDDERYLSLVFINYFMIFMLIDDQYRFLMNVHRLSDKIGYYTGLVVFFMPNN